jgi:hypothetical protein
MEVKIKKKTVNGSLDLGILENFHAYCSCIKKTLSLYFLSYWLLLFLTISRDVKILKSLVNVVHFQNTHAHSDFGGPQ